MKREFGKKLVEEHMLRWDLTHVIDADKAHIPGHAAPTVILFGKNQFPVASSIRTVTGIKKQEPAPEHAARGLVWMAILEQVDHPGSISEFVQVTDTPIVAFRKHPWSIGGGGIAELKLTLDSEASCTLTQVSQTIGYSGQTNADDAFLADRMVFDRHRLEHEFHLPFVIGDLVRDFVIADGDAAIFPYKSSGLVSLLGMPYISRYLWPSKTILGNRRTFSKQSYFEEGRPWWSWHQIALQRCKPLEGIIFAFVATHNHFVVNESLKIFNRSASFIKLKPERAKDYSRIAALLNASTACFWMKQVFQDKGAGGIGGGISAEAWERRFEFDCT